MKRIRITGDVHQYRYGSREHEAVFSRIDYHDIIMRYCEILERRGLRSTLYVTGLALDEDQIFWKKIQKRGHKIGLHTWDGFSSFLPGQGFVNRKFFGCAYGSVRQQRNDILRCADMKGYFGITDWRTHEYGSDGVTERILFQNGYKTISDTFDLPVGLFGFLPRLREPAFLKHVPIIAPEDHSCIKHLHIRDYRDGLWTPKKYCNFVKTLVTKKKQGVLQLHPVCQTFINDFGLFEKVCRLV